jgi:VWFA-related protein
MAGQSISMSFGVRVAILISIGTLYMAATPRGHSSQHPDTLRSGITAVPVNVRVLDRDGNPIRDLKQGDFAILEDGVPQTIAHFVLQSAPSSGDRAMAFNSGVEAAKSQRVNRTFLIVLGRGRLEGVVKGLSGVIRFVRSELGPGDRVAVLAYKKVTEFTTDRAAISTLLERYLQGHGAIEAKLDHFFLNSEVMVDIERLFGDPKLPAVRDLPQPYPPSNIGQLYLGVEYLRAIPGEKHLVFISEDGINFGRRVSAEFAAKASAEQIVVSPIQTAGTPLRLRQPSGRGRSTAVRQSARSFTQAFAYADLQNLALHTGGIGSAYDYAEEALNRLAEASSIQYALSYYPTNAAWDGTERKIEIRVNRPGVVVQHRRSYTALRESVPSDPALVLSRSRITAAGESPVEFTGIRLRIEVRELKDTAEREFRSITIAIFVDAASLGRQSNSGQPSTLLDVAVFCGGKDKNVVGELWQRAEVKWGATQTTPDVEITARVPVDGVPHYVKAVVYERTHDKLGSVVLALKDHQRD